MMRLSEQYLPLVAKVAKKFFPRFRGDWEELLRAGELGLVKAENGYKPDRGPFTTFAWACIKNEMCVHVRTVNRRRRREKAIENFPDKCREESGPALDDQDWIEALVPDAKTRQMLFLRYGEEMSLRELEQQTGLCNTTIHHRCHRALAKARTLAKGLK